MLGNPFQLVRFAGRLGLFAAALTLVTGCGFKIAGPGETVSIAAQPGEDLVSSCKFDMNMPDQPLSTTDSTSTAPVPVEAAVLVVYERGDSANLFNDVQVQNMAATLHMVTVFAHQCNSTSTGDIQSDATKGPGRELLAALTQYATDSKHPEIAKLKLMLSGFSAAGVLTTTMANAYPSRIYGYIPFASGSAYLDLDTVPVSAQAAQIPALILANAYDPDSGVQRSLRYFERGFDQGAPWGFGVQNHTAHCCTLSTRDIMIPWVTALTQPLESGGTETPTTAAVATAKVTATPKAQSGGYSPTVRFLCYTDGYQDAYYQDNCWIPEASILPSTTGGPEFGWLPDADSAAAWLKWVLSPGTN